MSPHRPGPPSNMSAIKPSIRLFVSGDLHKGIAVGIDTGQAHYLRNIMRRAPGDEILLFNGRHGEWHAVIRTLERGGGVLVAVEQTRAQRAGADLWLLAAPIKRTAIDFVASKATELGVSAIQPVLTKRTAIERVNTARMRANCLEAAEQCHRLTVPEIFEPKPLARILAAWAPARRILLCDETGAGAPIAEVLATERARMPEPWTILIGPEGGFDPTELDQLRHMPPVVPVSLGERLLRADTAALAALAIWQSVLGEWSSGA